MKYIKLLRIKHWKYVPMDELVAIRKRIMLKYYICPSYIMKKYFLALKSLLFLKTILNMSCDF